jgi:hypothetical protein
MEQSAIERHETLRTRQPGGHHEKKEAASVGGDPASPGRNGRRAHLRGSSGSLMQWLAVAALAGIGVALTVWGLRV